MKISIDWFTLIFMIFFDGVAYITLIPSIVRECKNKKRATAVRCQTDTEPLLEDTCEYCGGVYVHGLHISCPHCGAPIKALQQSGVDPEMLKNR